MRQMCCLCCNIATDIDDEDDEKRGEFGKFFQERDWHLHCVFIPLKGDTYENITENYYRGCSSSCFVAMGDTACCCL